MLLLVGSAAADVVRLEDLEAKAVERRGAAAAAWVRVAAARAGVDLARSARSPTAALNVDASGSPGGRLITVRDTSGSEYLVSGSRRFYESGAFIPQMRYGAVLAAQARLYDFGKTRAAIAAAEASAASAGAEEGAIRVEIVQEVRAAYLDWLAAVALHGTVERALANARARRQLVEARIATGMRPPSDLSPALYDEALAELDENEAEGRVRSAKLEVEQAGAAPLRGDALPDPSLLDRAPSAERPGELPSRVFFEKQQLAALAQAHLHERESSPVLMASAEAGLHGQATDLFPAYRATVSLSVPLWDGGVASAKAAVSRAEATALEAQLRERRASITTEHDRALSDLSSATERVRIAEMLRVVAAARVRDAEDRYDLGNEKIELVLEANGALARAEREVLLAKVARAGAILRLAGEAPSGGIRRAPTR